MMVDVVFKFDTENPADVLKMRQISSVLLDVQETTEEPENESDGTMLLDKFYREASEHQRKVLDWMKANPGRSDGVVLKNVFPFLQGRGLAGVFKKARWVQLGGSKEDCPFFQVEWDPEHGCGIYRGLTPEEAASVSW